MAGIVTKNTATEGYRSGSRLVSGVRVLQFLVLLAPYRCARPIHLPPSLEYYIVIFLNKDIAIDVFAQLTRRHGSTTLLRCS